MAVDIRQNELREESSTANQITDGSTTKVSDVLVSIDNEVRPPLRMHVTDTHDITVDAVYLTNPETGRKRVIPPISNLIPFSFSGSVVSFPATNDNDITSTGGGAPLPLNITAGHYARVGIHLNPLGVIVLSIGESNASIDSATSPAVPGNIFALGHIVVQNVAGTIQDLTSSSIWYYSGDAIPASTGNANIFETSIRDQLLLSPYRLATPNIFEVEQDGYVDPISDGNYSLVTNTYDLTVGQKFVSKQLLDEEEFLTTEEDVTSVDLTVFWDQNYIDDAATYEVSRNGGNEWQEVSMERISDSSKVYYGSHNFTDEASYQAIDDQTAEGGSFRELNASSVQSVSQSFSNLNASVVRQIELYISKTGSPTGHIYVSIHKDDGGSPGDVISETLPVDISSLSSGQLIVDMGTAPIKAFPDIYHFVIRTDSEYKSVYSAGSTVISIEHNSNGDGMSTYNGSIWSDSSTDGLKYAVHGRELDLRIRITASTTAKLDAMGIFYDLQPGVIGGVHNSYQTSFDSVADNFDEFELPFQPDSRLIHVYYQQAGLVYRYGAFNIVGRKIVFPADTFNNGGVPATVTLQFDQLYGNSFDSSDSNHALMQANHLGAEDSSIDRSATGRGIVLRNANGDLVELAIDSDNNITISTVP